MDKKGQAGMTGPLLAGITAVMILFILGFILAIGATLMEDLQDSDSGINNATQQTALHNVTGNSLNGFDSISGFQGTMGLIIAAILIISILLTLIGFFLFKKLGS